jgi:phage gpG-like protein
MIRVEWDIKATVAGLVAMLERLRNQSPAWRNVLVYLRGQTVQQFNTAGARSGDAWQPLSAGYEKWKAVKFPGQPILRATDAMFKSLTEDGAANAVADVSAQGLTYGTRDAKASYHQRGGGRLPRRKILAVTDADKRAIVGVVRNHIDGQGRASGFRSVP